MATQTVPAQRDSYHTLEEARAANPAPRSWEPTDRPILPMRKPGTAPAPCSVHRFMIGLYHAIDRILEHTQKTHGEEVASRLRVMKCLAMDIILMTQN